MLSAPWSGYKRLIPGSETARDFSLNADDDRDSKRQTPKDSLIFRRDGVFGWSNDLEPNFQANDKAIKDHCVFEIVTVLREGTLLNRFDQIVSADDI